MPPGGLAGGRLRPREFLRINCGGASPASGSLSSAREIRQTVGSGRLAVVMSIESQFIFMGRPDLLRDWYRLGVRVASLSHG